MTDGERTPENKHQALKAHAKLSDGAIAQLFVAHGLGHAYASSGKGSSKARRIATAMMEAERRGEEDLLYDAIMAAVGSPSAELELSPRSMSAIRHDASTAELPRPRAEPQDPDANERADPEPTAETVVLTRAGRRRTLTGGSIVLLGVAISWAIFAAPPTNDPHISAALHAFGATTTAIGALIYTQTLGHRGKPFWRSVSRSTIPGSLIAALGFICLVYLTSPPRPDVLETVATAAMSLGILWATVGLLLIHRYSVEQVASELSSPRVENNDGHPVEGRLSRGEVLIILTGAFQGLATLVAALIV